MIHKLRFEPESPFSIVVPGHPMHVNVQDGHRTIWYEFGGYDTRVVIMGTGQNFPICGMKYINTFFEGEFVWHAYAMPHKVDV